MALSSVLQLKEIRNALSDDQLKKIVLYGEPGVGKTWMAKKSSDRAMREDVFDITLWIFLSRKYDRRALCESIAGQLCIISTGEDSKVEDENKEAKIEEIENMKRKIKKTLSEKRLLLILDDEGNKMTEEQINSELESLMLFDLNFMKKILITRGNNTKGRIPEGKVIEVKPLPRDESLSLLRQRDETEVYEFPGIKVLADAFIEKSRGVPAEIIATAKALNYFGKHVSGVQKLESALAEESDTNNHSVLRSVCSESSEHELLPVGILIDWCWRCRDFFRECESVHYNELITYWILEGYLGHVDIENAYEKGHRFLMDLIDCGVLKKLEAGYVNIPVLDNCHLRGFDGTASLRLATVFDGEWKGLGKITRKDGMIKTLCKGENENNLFTLLLDGNHILGDVLINFLESKQELQVLAIFNPTFKSLPSSFSKMRNLLMLVIRGCDFLQDINLTLDIKLLTALEISGSHSLKTIPDDFFKNMAQLRSLNLSQLQISALPSSLYNLSKLRCLVLRGCSQLEKLEGLRRLTNLVALDLSGATSLKSIADKTLSKNQKLQTINLSETKIRTLPLLRDLSALTHLLLRGCTQLDRLRSINSLTNLKVLDISGAPRFKEFQNPSFANLGELEILRLSGTSLDHLPSNISNLYYKGCDLRYPRSTRTQTFSFLSCLRVLNLSETNINELLPLFSLCNLRELLLSHCVSLLKLPELNSLGKLEVLDLSHCIALTEIQDRSFEHMSHLWRLNLSETKIECLPTLSNPSNLRYLLLAKCTRLKELSLPNSLSKLEELNISGISVLGESGADFVEHMSNLKILNLSETMLQRLPSMENLKNLNYLSLKGCTRLETMPNLEALTKLEVLDLSGTAVRHLPCLESFSNLRQLLLRDCSSIEEFQHLEMLDLLLLPTVDELSFSISKLTRCEFLDPPNMKNIRGADTNKTIGPREQENRQPWIISSWPADALTDGNKHGISVTSTQFLELLEKNPLWWETSFKRFHFLVCPTEAQNMHEYRFFYRNDLIFRDIYFQTVQFPHCMERERSLEIHGFHSFPKGVEDILRHAEFVFLIDNPFIQQLSDLGTNNIKEMKVCWIERCAKLESLLHVEKVENIAKPGEIVEEMSELGENIEILRVSYVTSLKNLYSGNPQGNVFKNLKCFYLEYCPKVANVFSSSQGLENLEVLQVKFCNGLEALFEQESAALPKLHTLHMWALPSLKRVGCEMPSLRSLNIGECPLLVSAISSSQLPENLETLQIKFCVKLETAIENSTSTICTLDKLRTLCLWELPELKSIGAEFPSLQDCNIRECLKLQNPPVMSTVPES